MNLFNYLTFELICQIINGLGHQFMSSCIKSIINKIIYLFLKTRSAYVRSAPQSMRELDSKIFEFGQCGDVSKSWSVTFFQGQHTGSVIFIITFGL